MTLREVSASEFKARCLALLDEVSRGRATIMVTKRGKPIAKIVPVTGRPPPDLQGTILYEGDIISPIDERWEAGP